MKDWLICGPNSLHDANAVWAKLILADRVVVLGHVERVAAALAPMMDASMHGLIIRRY